MPKAAPCMFMLSATSVHFRSAVVCSKPPRRRTWVYTRWRSISCPSTCGSLLNAPDESQNSVSAFMNFMRCTRRTSNSFVFWTRVGNLSLLRSIMNL